MSFLRYCWHHFLLHWRQSIQCPQLPEEFWWLSRLQVELSNLSGAALTDVTVIKRERFIQVFCLSFVNKDATFANMKVRNSSFYRGRNFSFHLSSFLVRACNFYWQKWDSTKYSVNIVNMQVSALQKYALIYSQCSAECLWSESTSRRHLVQTWMSSCSLMHCTLPSLMGSRLIEHLFSFFREA